MIVPVRYSDIGGYPIAPPRLTWCIICKFAPCRWPLAAKTCNPHLWALPLPPLPIIPYPLTFVAQTTTKSIVNATPTPSPTRTPIHTPTTIHTPTLNAVVSAPTPGTTQAAATCNLRLAWVTLPRWPFTDLGCYPNPACANRYYPAPVFMWVTSFYMPTVNHRYGSPHSWRIRLVTFGRYHRHLMLAKTCRHRLVGRLYLPPGCYPRQGS